MLIKKKKRETPLHPICETDNKKKGKRGGRATKSNETQVVAFYVGVGFGLSLLLHS